MTKEFMEKFDSRKRDAMHKERLEELFRERGYSPWDALRHWQAYILRRDLPRFIAHYELFKKTIDLPGCIVELGVYKGASFFTWANLLDTFNTSDRSKRVFGFDHFEGLLPEQFDEKKDGGMDDSVQKSHFGYKCTAEELRTLVRLHNDDHLSPGLERAVLIEGDVTETIPKFLEDYPGLKISLVHFDMDLYKPTKYCLDMLYPYVLNGGAVCFDEYGNIPWEGETRAVDEFFAEQGIAPVMHRMPFHHSPSAYFIK